MYQYTEVDQKLVDERVAQYRDQTRRYLAGELPDEEFRALRLMNGLYIQRQAPMLRVAVPYGLMSSTQMRKLAHIARTYDKGYGHFTTRTNIQYNWPKLEEVPDILAELAEVQMHAIQTSGNCIRNTTTDPYAGVIASELEDPRPWCEIIRQWSTLHPEFAYLPRKFKIAVTGGPEDRAASQVHDIGLHLVKNDAGQIGFEVLVGGGLGRTPIIGKQINPFLDPQDLLSYLEAIIRVYNLNGRRDNKYKARIKILVSAMGIDAFREQVEAEWAEIRESDLRLSQEEIDKVKAQFAPPAYDADAVNNTLDAHLAQNDEFRIWYERNTVEHKVPGYRIVVVSLKPYLKAPGDITDLQMEAVADLADRFSFGEIRATHHQNLVLADVKQGDLHEVWKILNANNLARPNIGTLTDMIVCPGFDFCSLANAKTLNIAEQINEKFEDVDYMHDIGEIRLNMSGCINACAHHHVGHIGILGVDKKGEDWYQFTLGGSSEAEASLGKVLGKSIAADEVANTIEKILLTYIDQRDSEAESFLEVVRRVGVEPFKEAVYAADH
ncbi:nitrite/sulfite reductase [Marinobacterium sediminicola]|uniref:Sulfite reductase (NADPH) hemoprotein beta-component n=1 Tax=Marinobacterium sediminicola TaxID=518898 RepID=A0ABY1RWJ2_9GAMM|nr:nitrite/sulfite reductase [Marinobacterium sediminicola]ULG70312.1 nitrite/sulfite reductase [Marinobacterium sediminicola]SMR69754.1 sulfite reductase (NADPH) hemoprotein beta-component [Marinobacterium sediminicola]